jgi:hypothetical protein
VPTTAVNSSDTSAGPKTFTIHVSLPLTPSPQLWQLAKQHNESWINRMSSRQMQVSLGMIRMITNYGTVMIIVTTTIITTTTRRCQS